MEYSHAELQDMEGLPYKLAGTAGMFGEAELGDRARDLEEGIAEWTPDTRVTRIRAAIKALERAA